MTTLAVCAIFKDEGPNLAEWVAYHRVVGVDHFVLYDNDSTDDGSSIILAGPLRDYVTIIPFSCRPAQPAAYEHFRRFYPNSWDWVAFIDLDEFIHPIDADSIKDLLPKYERYSGVLLHWLNFGPNGHDTRPDGLVIANYTYRLPGTHGINRHVKSLVKSADLVRANIHVHETTGPLCNSRGEPAPREPIQDCVCHDVMCINHYYTKSRADWDAKIRRGLVQEPDEKQFDRPNAWFAEHAQLSTIHDVRITRFMESILTVMGYPATIGHNLTLSKAEDLPHSSEVSKIRWLHTIHQRSPYDGFPCDLFEEDLQGWGWDSPIFERVISQYRPQIVVEIGSWKGASANQIADIMKRHRISDPQIICVDTWLGSVENWLNRTDPNFFASLKTKWGTPQIYFQFISNVLRRGNADVIVPFPTSSSAAARFLSGKGFVADAIYVDGGHDYEDVVADLQAFWGLLKPGGIMLGDNYVLGWIGVVRAVHDFADLHHLDIDTSVQQKWLLVKPVADREFAASSSPDRRMTKPAGRMSETLGKGKVVSTRPDRSALPRFAQSNLALNRMDTQSSTSRWSWHENPEEDARGAVNGNITGSYGFHTDLEDKPWWMVTLDSIESVAHLVIYNRLDGDFARRAATLKVELSADQFDWEVLEFPNQDFGGADGRPLIIHLVPPRRARFVRVTLREGNYLHLDQVEVYGPDEITRPKGERTRWLTVIHDSDPYQDFPIADYHEDRQGWGFESPIFDHVIKHYCPQTIIEVGTWKGASAIKMANLLRWYDIDDPQIICIDTWLGSVENWHDGHVFSIPTKWGRPDLYNQFMANVIFSQCSDIIVPFSVNSLTAARFLKHIRMIADAIYIDAGHDYEDVSADLDAYWELVAPGGVMFGDDYVLGWIGVVRAVHDFADIHRLTVDTSFHHKWMIKKPGGRPQELWL